MVESLSALRQRAHAAIDRSIAEGVFHSHAEAHAWLGLRLRAAVGVGLGRLDRHQLARVPELVEEKLGRAKAVR